MSRRRRRRPRDRAESARASCKEGFSWPALLCSPLLWLLYQRLWLELSLPSSRWSPCLAGVLRSAMRRQPDRSAALERR